MSPPGKGKPLLLTPIGVIHTPHQDLARMPIQPSGARGVAGRIELDPALAEGLKDLEGFSHILVLYHFHRVNQSTLLVTPFLDEQPHGIFATRAPTRPNPIGLSVLKLVEIRAGSVFVEDVDMQDGTPLLDIKPYVPAFDHPDNVRIGWLEGLAGRAGHLSSDERFV